MGFNWQGKFDYKALIERVKIADQAGVHSVWVPEAWGRDAFTMLTLCAEHTSQAQLATSIVNIYSRTPAALAQHFATLDELSGGRMIAGLGTSGPKKEAGGFRVMVQGGGRDLIPAGVTAPGPVQITADVARAKAAHAGTLAFYAARMGTFYAEQLTRFGFGNEVNRIKEAWASGGAKAGTEAVAPKLADEIGYVGDVNGAAERLAAQEEGGVDLHPLDRQASDLRAYEKTLATLAG